MMVLPGYIVMIVKLLYIAGRANKPFHGPASFRAEVTKAIPWVIEGTLLAYCCRVQVGIAFAVYPQFKLLSLNYCLGFETGNVSFQ